MTKTLGEELREENERRAAKIKEQQELADRDAHKIAEVEAKERFDEIIPGLPARIKGRNEHGHHSLEVLKAGVDRRFTLAEKLLATKLGDWAKINGLNYIHSEYKRDWDSHECLRITWK